MDLMQAAQAAHAVATAATATDMETVDWRSVAYVAGSLIGVAATVIMTICGWVWLSTMAWLRRMNESFLEHVKDDSQAFAEVKEMLHRFHIDTLTAINDARQHRYNDGDGKHK